MVETNGLNYMFNHEVKNYILSCTLHPYPVVLVAIKL